MNTWKAFLEEELLLRKKQLTQTDLEELAERIATWRRLFKKSFKEESFCYPLFEVEEHWPRMIQFLGPVTYQNGKAFENMLAESKEAGRATNLKNVPEQAMNGMLINSIYRPMQQALLKPKTPQGPRLPVRVMSLGAWEDCKFGSVHKRLIREIVENSELDWEEDWDTRYAKGKEK